MREHINWGKVQSIEYKDLNDIKINSENKVLSMLINKHNYLNALLLVILAVIVVATIGLRYANPVSDGDIWFHLAYGRYFIEYNSLTLDHSLFTWTFANNPWIYCAWIPQIIFYLFFKVWGMYGLCAIRYLFILTFFLLVFTSIIKNRIIFLPSILLICLCGLLMAQAGLRIKADLFSFFFMTFEVWLWFRIKTQHNKNWHLFYLFPAMFLIWVNSHPGFIFGIIYISLVSTGELINWITGSREKLNQRLMKHLFISIILSIVTVVITPYGWRYPAQLLNELIFNSGGFYKDINTLMEYQSIFYPDALPLHFVEYLIISSGILIFLLYQQIRRKQIDWPLLIVNLFFVIMYVKYLRLTYYWAIIFTFSSIHLLGKISESHSEIFTKKPLTQLVQIITVFLLLFFSLRAWYETLSSSNIYWPPSDEAAYIKVNYPKLRVGNDYDIGTYLLWSLWPANKIFIDARFVPFSSWYNEYIDFINTSDKTRRDLFLKKYSCDLWCFSYGNNIIKYFMRSPDWRLAYYGPSACIFISRRISNTDGHIVSNSIDKINFYQALAVLHFAYEVGDLQIAKRLAIGLKPSFFYPKQKTIAFDSMIFMGDVFNSQKHYNDAADIYSAAIKIKPDSAITYFKKGNAEIKLNKIVDAIKSLQISLNLDPNLDMAYNNLGNAFMLTHKLDEAFRCYSAALRINPHNAEVIKNIAIAEDYKKIETSISHLKEELKAQPNNVKLIRALAIFYAKKGDYPNALASLKQLLSYSPKDPDSYYNEACIYAKMNRVDESIKWLNLAMKRGFCNWSLMKEDSDLANIRQTIFYKRIIQNH
jgi:Tfp pilus assembly protein PilF